MCGKFTAMASWREVHDFSQPVAAGRSGGDGEVTYGVAKPLPVIVWDREAGKRSIIPMRWGYPYAKDWRRPQPIHARSETIETTKAFAESFATGQRGIVVFKTFNEGKELSATKQNNGPLIRRTAFRAASLSCGDDLKFPIFRNRCSLRHDHGAREHIAS